jgi:hypothetical protein
MGVALRTPRKLQSAAIYHKRLDKTYLKVLQPLFTTSTIRVADTWLPRRLKTKKGIWMQDPYP